MQTGTARRMSAAKWGGPPGPRGTPWSRLFVLNSEFQQADQGSAADKGSTRRTLKIGHLRAHSKERGQGVPRGPGGPPHKR